MDSIKKEIIASINFEEFMQVGCGERSLVYTGCVITRCEDQESVWEVRRN